MLKQFVICLSISVFTMACAAFSDQKLVSAPDRESETAVGRGQDKTKESRNAEVNPGSKWQPFKGVLLRHIVANCCFSETQNTVILGQDNNADQKVDRCYQLKGQDGKIYYRTIECPYNLAPIKAPRRNKNLQCRLN